MKVLILSVSSLLLSAGLALGQQPVQVKHLAVPSGGGAAPQQGVATYQQQPAAAVGDGSQNAYGQMQQQIMQTAYNQQNLVDLENIQLPPIEILMKSLEENASQLYYYEMGEKAMLSDAKTEKRHWMNSIHINGMYQYGYNVYSSDKGFLENGIWYPDYNNTKQSWWNVGASISLPLDDIFNRGNRIRRFEYLAEQQKAQVGEWLRQQQLLIEQTYTEAQLCLKLIKIKSEMLEIARVQYSLAQADQINGRINFTELSNSKAIHNLAETEYEQMRTSLSGAILRLQTLSYYKIMNH